jgi:hypothetical protein
VIDKNITLDRTRTSCLKPEVIEGISTGDLLSPEVAVDIVTGDLLAAKAKVNITPGNLLTAKALPDYYDLPLNYARIYYDNTLLNGLASATSDDLKSANMLTPSTYDKWRPAANPSDCTLIGTSQLCDYVAIAAHNLSGSTVVINVSNGGALTEVYNSVVPSNIPLLVRFTEGTYDRVFIEISGTTTAEIAVVYLGKELVMMRPIYSGYSPATLSSKDVFTPQTSDGGQFLGKQLVRKGFNTSASFSHLTYEWYEAEFQPFVLHAKKYPYFWAFNLLEHPSEVVYGWTNQNITPSLMGIRNWLEVSFDIDAHGNI